MSFFQRLLQTLSLALLCVSSAALADISHREDVRAFMYRMNAKYSYPLSDLQYVFKNINVNFDVLALMSKPAEKKPWYLYKTITLAPERIQKGAQFWQAHQRTLEQAEQRYGVPAKIIVGIIGVETLYGKNVGTFKVPEALATLGFEGESRNEFFLSELEQFLVLCRDWGWNPLHFVGSYAGAMGIPQFMPSNIRRFGASAVPGRRTDLVHNVDDAIMSVACYLYKHGWVKNGLIAARARVSSTTVFPAWNKQKPNYSMAQLQRLHVQPAQTLRVPVLAQAGLLPLESEPKNHEHWLTFHNFYVITTYNRSPLYAMSVWQLGTLVERQVKHA